MSFILGFGFGVLCTGLGTMLVCCCTLAAYRTLKNPFAAGSGNSLPQGRSSTHGTEQTGASRLVVERNGDLRYHLP